MMYKYVLLALLGLPAALFGMEHSERDDAQVYFFKQISQVISSLEHNVASYLDKTMLHYATACGNLSDLELHLKNNEFVGTRDIYGRTPLHHAVRFRASEQESRQFLLTLLTHSFFQPQVHTNRLEIKAEEEKEGILKKIRSIISRIYEKIIDKEEEFDEEEYDTFINNLEVILPIVVVIIMDELSLKEQRALVKRFEQDPKHKWCAQSLQEAHCARHLRLIKESLGIQDNQGQTVGDLARKRKMLGVVGLIDHVCRAESFEHLDEALRGNIESTINTRLKRKPFLISKL